MRSGAWSGTGNKNALYPSVSIYKPNTSGECAHPSSSLKTGYHGYSLVTCFVYLQLLLYPLLPLFLSFALLRSSFTSSFTAFFPPLSPCFLQPFPLFLLYSFLLFSSQLHSSLGPDLMLQLPLVVTAATCFCFTFTQTFSPCDHDTESFLTSFPFCLFLLAPETLRENTPSYSICVFLLYHLIKHIIILNVSFLFTQFIYNDALYVFNISFTNVVK